MKRFRNLNGYVLRYKPGHHRALCGANEGYVYEHILVAEKKLKRYLLPGEIVHHLDTDRSNNSPHNLVVVSKHTHNTIHAWINKGCIINFNDGVTTNIPRCKVCKMPVPVKNKKVKKYCSKRCRVKMYEKKDASRISKEKLHRLLSNHSWVKVAAYLEMTDNGARKLAKRLGLNPKHYKRGSYIGPC